LSLLFLGTMENEHHLSQHLLFLLLGHRPNTLVLLLTSAGLGR
jgi:hypothetical protein